MEHSMDNVTKVTVYINNDTLEKLKAMAVLCNTTVTNMLNNSIEWSSYLMTEKAKGSTLLFKRGPQYYSIEFPY